MQKCPNRQRELKYQEFLHPVAKKANTSLREPILIISHFILRHQFINPFAPEPPVTARADPRPFYPL